MSEREKKKGRKIRIDEGMIERLEETAKRLGLEVRYEQLSKASYAGGLCRVKQAWIVIVNRASVPLEKAEVLAEAIATREIDGVYLAPDVREIVEWVRSKRKKYERG